MPKSWFSTLLDSLVSKFHPVRDRCPKTMNCGTSLRRRECEICAVAATRRVFLCRAPGTSSRRGGPARSPPRAGGTPPSPRSNSQVSLAFILSLAKLFSTNKLGLVVLVTKKRCSFSNGFSREILSCLVSMLLTMIQQSRDITWDMGRLCTLDEPNRVVRI